MIIYRAGIAIYIIIARGTKIVIPIIIISRTEIAIDRVDRIDRFITVAVRKESLRKCVIVKRLLRISSVLGGSCRLGEVRRSFDLGVSANT